MSRFTITTCCVFSCNHDGAAVRPRVNAGGAIFCSKDNKALVVRGGWLTCGFSMACSRAQRPSVIARSPMRTRKEEPTAIPGELQTPGAMRGDVDISTCARVAGGTIGETVRASAAGLPLPLLLPTLLSIPGTPASCPSPDELRSSGGGESGAKLSILGVKTATPGGASPPPTVERRVSEGSAGLCASRFPSQDMNDAGMGVLF